MYTDDEEHSVKRILSSIRTERGQNIKIANKLLIDLVYSVYTGKCLLWFYRTEFAHLSPRLYGSLKAGFVQASR